MDSDANNSAHAKSQARKKPLIAGRLDNNKSDNNFPVILKEARWSC